MLNCTVGSARDLYNAITNNHLANFLSTFPVSVFTKIRIVNTKDVRRLSANRDHYVSLF
ncbi:hypothetical protein Hanom_Chr17g01546531 [Helianthus anomalus]